MAALYLEGMALLDPEWRYLNGFDPELGAGGPVNPIRADELMRQAADLGHADATYVLFVRQEGTTELLELAAKRGSARAMVELALRQLTCNKKMCVELIRRAADLGYVIARLFLAAMHFAGFHTMKVDCLTGYEIVAEIDQTKNQHAQEFVRDFIDTAAMQSMLTLIIARKRSRLPPEIWRYIHETFPVCVHHQRIEEIFN